jgi:hypothetical protein
VSLQGVTAKAALESQATVSALSGGLPPVVLDEVAAEDGPDNFVLHLEAVRVLIRMIANNPSMKYESRAISACVFVKSTGGCLTLMSMMGSCSFPCHSAWVREALRPMEDLKLLRADPAGNPHQSSVAIASVTRLRVSQTSV